MNSSVWTKSSRPIHSASNSCDAILISDLESKSKLVDISKKKRTAKKGVQKFDGSGPMVDATGKEIPPELWENNPLSSEAHEGEADPEFREKLDKLIDENLK